MAGLKAEAVNLYLRSGPRVKGVAHRALATLVPGRRALEFYWSAACPYSYLMAQQLARVTAGSALAIAVRPMPLGAAEVNPAPQLREQHGPRDCAALANFYDVDFPSEWAIPSAELIAMGNQIVASALSLEACIAVGRALWRNDAALMTSPAKADSSPWLRAPMFRETRYWQPLQTYLLVPPLPSPAER